MKRAFAALALAGLLASPISCARRTVEGRWHLDREHTTMPMGMKIPGESYLEIKLGGDGADLRDFVSSPETGSQTLMDRHYPFGGKELEVESDANGALYTSARLEGTTLYTVERIVHRDPEAGPPEARTSVTYTVSWTGLQLTGTDESGKVAVYDRQ